MILRFPKPAIRQVPQSTHAESSRLSIAEDTRDEQQSIHISQLK